MTKTIKVEGLCKTYQAFKLNNVSFSLEGGKIMGFIGRNGAGKTTTIKSLLNIVHPDCGEIDFFGIPLRGNENAVKQRIGYASGGNIVYPRRKLREIAAVTASFYEKWDDEAYRGYMEKFNLDENKKIMELSEGMKVKFSLALALSHHADLLILDEPTSGLDPVSRDELLEIFMDIASEGVAILFSTHIISDLEKCADMISYIRKGEIITSCSMSDFVGSYRIVELPEPPQGETLGVCRSRDGYTALIPVESAASYPGCREATPEEIMLHLEKEETK